MSNDPSGGIRQEPQPTEAEIAATEAARKLAEEKGVNLADVQPSGEKVTLPDVRSHLEGTEGGAVYYFYCMEESHPGVPNFQSEPLNVGRIYQSAEDPPVCPSCGRQTNSIPCAGPDMPPEYAIQLQERFGR